jgi:hypothetical protein
MSTNIQIDVVLRKLQEQSEQIKGKNQEQREEREEEAELAQKKAEKERKDKRAPADNSELTVNEPGQSPPTGEQLKKKEADSKSKALNSTDPDIARTKEEPAGFVAGGLNLMYCIYSRINAGDGQVDHTFVTASGARFVFRKRLGSIFDSYSYIDPLADSLLSQTGFDQGAAGFRDVSTATRDGATILPLGNKTFLYVYFVEKRERASQAFTYGVANPRTGEGKSVYLNRAEVTVGYELCVLVGPDNAREVKLPSRLLQVLQGLYPMPITEDYEVGIFTRATQEDYPNSQPFLDLTWDWGFFNLGGTKSYTQQRGIYGHYLDNFDVAGPAVYWWLANASEDDVSELTAEQIRKTIRGPVYGRSRNNSWYATDGSLNPFANEPYTPEWVAYPERAPFASSDDAKPARLTGPYKNQSASLAGLIFPDILVAWDGNEPSYCTASAVALGFTPEDLTF